MHEIVFLYFAVWLSCTTTNVFAQTCSGGDCVTYDSCEVAMTLLLKKEQAAKDLLRSAFCGRSGNKYKVCCSVLENASPVMTDRSTSNADPPPLPDNREPCGECVTLDSCAVAIALLERNEPATNALLKSKFCGKSGNNYMVCCAALTSAVSPATDNIENHPNLHRLPDNCGIINGDKIKGGYTVGLFEFPWMVLISHKRGDELSFGCGGSLINERYVLTAAHCFTKPLAGARVAENDIRNDPDCQNGVCAPSVQDFYIEKIIPHPNYDEKISPHFFDIGLLRLRNPVDFSRKNAGTICLPVTRGLQSRELSGLNATVAGWGSTAEGQPSSPTLQAADVRIHSTESCREMYNRGNKPGEGDATINKFCAGQVDKDTCSGDSGGPLMVKGAYKSLGHRWVQHGIISFGPTRCGATFPTVFTDVSKYMKWILDTIES